MRRWRARRHVSASVCERMRVSEWRELCADSRRLRISVGERHFAAIVHYMRTRGARYSPEFLKMWRLFERNPGVLYAYWDVVGELYRALAATGENALTRSLGLTCDRDRLRYGYAIPATLGSGVVSNEKRVWVARQMHRHPLLVKEWVFACVAYAHDPSQSIGGHLLSICPSSHSPLQNLNSTHSAPE